MTAREKTLLSYITLLELDGSLDRDDGDVDAYQAGLVAAIGEDLEGISQAYERGEVKDLGQ